MSRQHLPVLDGLRGLAIALVLVVHHLNYAPLAPWFHFGFAGVDLFFVLSGFLITGILLDTRDTPGWLRVFFQRRALRTLPLYYAVLAGFALIAPLHPVTAWFPHYQWYFWTHGSSFLVLRKGFMNPLGHFWSLSLEEQFYLIWPLLVAACSRRLLTRISILLLLIGVGLRFTLSNTLLTYGLLPAHLDGLLGGALLAIAVRQPGSAALPKASKLFPLASILLLLQTAALLVAPVFFQTLIEPFTLTIVAFFFTTLLARLLLRPLPVFCSAPMRFLGKYSYGIYVFDSLFIHFSNWAGVDRLAPIGRIAVYIFLLPAVLATAWASYHLFEKHFLRLKPRYPAAVKAAPVLSAILISSSSHRPSCSSASRHR